MQPWAAALRFGFVDEVNNEVVQNQNEVEKGAYTANTKISQVIVPEYYQFDHSEPRKIPFDFEQGITYILTQH